MTDLDFPPSPLPSYDVLCYRSPMTADHDFFSDPPKTLVGVLTKSDPIFWFARQPHSGRQRGDRYEVPLIRCTNCGRQHLPQTGRHCPCGADLPFEVYR
jgi:hypothetical protein